MLSNNIYLGICNTCGKAWLYEEIEPEFWKMASIYPSYFFTPATKLENAIKVILYGIAEETWEDVQDFSKFLISADVPICPEDSTDLVETHLIGDTYPIIH